MQKAVFHSFFFIVKFMKSRNDVELNKKLSTNQMIENFLQLKNKISIFNNNVIKFSVIHIYLNIFFKFANKDY